MIADGRPRRAVHRGRCARQPVRHAVPSREEPGDGAAAHRQLPRLATLSGQAGPSASVAGQGVSPSGGRCSSVSLVETIRPDPPVCSAAGRPIFWWTRKEDSPMLNQIQGLHHVTSMAADARANNAFFTDTLGLRRVKKTVNFDAPDVYHLYYGDEVGTPGSVMTYFPFPHIGRRAQGHRRGRADRLRGAEGRAPLLARAAGRARGVSGTRRGRALRRAAADLHRAGRRRVRAGRGRRRPRAPWTGGGVPGRGGDPRLPRRLAPAPRRRRDRGAAALHGLRAEAETARRRHPLASARAATAPTSSTSRRCPARRRPTSAPARSTTSPSRCRTGRRSSRCARRCSTPATR